MQPTAPEILLKVAELLEAENKWSAALNRPGPESAPFEASDIDAQMCRPLRAWWLQALDPAHLRALAAAPAEPDMSKNPEKTNISAGHVQSGDISAAPTPQPAPSEAGLLARLTSEIAGQLERRTAERDRHPVGSKEWFYLEEQRNTLENVLRDMQYALENGVTRLEFMRAVALNSPTPQPAPELRELLAAEERKHGEAVKHAADLEGQNHLLKLEIAALKVASAPQPAPDALREALRAWVALYVLPGVMDSCESEGWWSDPYRKAIELTRAALAEAGA